MYILKIKIKRRRKKEKEEKIYINKEYRIRKSRDLRQIVVKKNTSR